MGTIGVRCRSVLTGDQDFLDEMLYQAVQIADGKKPPREVLLAEPTIQIYSQQWGRRGDLGCLAVRDGVQLGAAWSRLYSAEQPGFGFIDAETPELCIAVLPEHRGQGVGSLLLQQLLVLVKRRHPAVSLSVLADNPAVGWYEKNGFEKISKVGDSWTMRKGWG